MRTLLLGRIQYVGNNAYAPGFNKVQSPEAVSPRGAPGGPAGENYLGYVLGCRQWGLCRIGITRFRSPILVQIGGGGGGHSEIYG